MPWQLTTLAHRVARAVGAGPAPVALASGPGGAGGPVVPLGPAELAHRNAAVLPVPVADRLADARRSDTALGPALDRLLAGDPTGRAAVELARRWPGLAPVTRDAVLDPVGVLGRAARQTDATTCGPASLAMLAAVGDPGLALWLADGSVLVAALPPELSGAGPGALAALERAPVARRAAVLQRVLHRRTTARAVLGLPWPATFGTPPWGAATHARFPGVSFRSRMLDDTDTADLAAVLGRVRAALAHGVPVPLYTGGDSARGWRTALPRHVVLAVGVTDDGLLVWEPSCGRVLRITTDRLLAASGEPEAALGGWGHVCWALLPH